MREPGLDRHEWETEWEQLQEPLEDSPLQTLPELGDLVEQMLKAGGYPVDGVADDGRSNSDLGISFRSAREVTLRVERGDDVDLGDVADAIHAYREIYEQLIDQPRN